MRIKLVIIVALAVVLACTGPTGPTGPQGTPGDGQIEPIAYHLDTVAVQAGEPLNLAPNGGQDYDIMISGDPLYIDAAAIQVATNDSIAPIYGYSTAIRVESYPQAYWIICQDLIHFARVVLDSADGAYFYIHYTLNMDPNNTRF